MKDSKLSMKEPEKDPYDVLGVIFGASDKDINKAYRKRALRLHPDKTQHLSDREKDKIEQQFHDLQIARDFLLNHDYQEARRKYDAKRQSLRARQAADQEREKHLSQSKKRMREQLEKEEALASATQNKHQHRHHERHHNPHGDDDRVQQLRKQGQAMRQAYAEQASHDGESERKKAKERLQDRQIRVKWSRKKINPSQEALATRFGAFGTVEHVEWLGNKGNAALITLNHPNACESAVKEYLDSDVMRASYVGRRKEVEDEKVWVANEPPTSPPPGRDHESLEDWKRRRDAAREELLRQMENEDEDRVGAASIPSTRDKTSGEPFPVPFPDNMEGETPFERLLNAEKEILIGINIDFS